MARRTQRTLPGVARTHVWFAPDLEHARYPDPALGNAPATPYAQGLTGWDAQQDQWRPARWYQPEDATEGLVPPAIPFDPATAAALYGYDPVVDRDSTERRFAPEASVEGDVPRPNAPTHPDHGYDAQQDRSTAHRWYQPDTEAWTPLPFLTVAPVAERAGLWLEQPGQERPVVQVWEWTDREVRPPPTGLGFAPSVEQLAGLWTDSSIQRGSGFAVPPPDDEAPPPFYGLPSGFDPATGFDWSEQPQAGQQPWPTAADTLLGVNATTEFEPAHLSHGYDAQQDRDQTPRWFAPEPEAQTPQPVAPFDPATLDHGYDAQQDRDQTERRFAPEASAEGLVPRPNASTGAELAEQPQEWRTPRWFAPEPEAGALQPPAPPFDPATGFDWSEQPQEWRPQRWLTLDDDASPSAIVPPPVQRWYLTDQIHNANLYDGDASRRLTLSRPFDPIVTANTPTSHSFIDLDGTFNAYRWYMGPLTGPGGSDPGPSGYTISKTIWFGLWMSTDALVGNDRPVVDMIVREPGVGVSTYQFRSAPAQLLNVGSRTLYLFSAVAFGLAGDIPLTRDSEVSFEIEIVAAGGTTQHLAFNGATPDVDGDSWVGFLKPLTPLPLVPQTAQDASTQQDSPTTQRWFSPDLLPGDGLVPIPDAVFDPAPFADAWGDHSAQQTRSTAPTWFAPEAATLGDIPRASAAVFDPATGFDWSEQPQVAATPWAAGADTLLGVNATTEFEPANLSHGWDAQQDHEQRPRWFAPEAAILGDIPRASAPTTPAPPFDYDAGQDRSTGARWFAPEAGVEAYVPSVPTVAPAAEQAPLWIEQPYPLGGNAQRWYSHAVEPVDGNLAAWLFAPGDPGATPAVLINAENGDVYLWIGGNFIVPAS